MFDAVDGFAGLSAKCLEYLEDEYSKCLFNVPVMPPTTKNSQFAGEWFFSFKKPYFK